MQARRPGRPCCPGRPTTSPSTARAGRSPRRDSRSTGARCSSASPAPGTWDPTNDWSFTGVATTPGATPVRCRTSRSTRARRRSGATPPGTSRRTPRRRPARASPAVSGDHRPAAPPSPGRPPPTTWASAATTSTWRHDEGRHRHRHDPRPHRADRRDGVHRSRGGQGRAGNSSAASASATFTTTRPRRTTPGAVAARQARSSRRSPAAAPPSPGRPRPTTWASPATTSTSAERRRSCATATGTTHTVTGLTAATAYTVRGPASDAAGNLSTLSDTVTFTTTRHPTGKGCTATYAVTDQLGDGFHGEVTVETPDVGDHRLDGDLEVPQRPDDQPALERRSTPSRERTCRSRT